MRTDVGKAGFSIVVLAACAAMMCLAVPDSALGAAPAGTMRIPPGPPPEGPTMDMATGADSSVDGYLRVGADSYGAWASAGFGGLGDGFNPTGAVLEEVAFTSALFFFQPAFSERELLTTNATHQGVFPADGSILTNVISASVASDSSGNGTDDTLDSQFEILGPGSGLALIVDLHQVVTSGESGGAVLTQTYSIENVANLFHDIVLTRVLDGDLFWVGDFADDEVGTDAAATAEVAATMREDGDPVLGVRVDSPEGTYYFGAKRGYDPDGAGVDPPHDYGTDTEIWDNFGLPVSWRDFIPEVGVGIDGFSGPLPPGCAVDGPCDAHVGVEVHLTLVPFGVTSVTFVHTYGTPSDCGDLECGKGENQCNCELDCGTPPDNEIPGDTCQDGEDNDCDQLTDCDDPDCADVPACDPCIDGQGNCFAPNGTPGCNNEDCCNLVCDQNPFCCDVGWDQSCADAAQEKCGNTACGEGAGDCCEPNGSPGCDQVICCKKVCLDDAFCCDVEWDQVCASAAASLGCCPVEGPTVSEWGMLAMLLLLFTVATIVIRGRRAVAGDVAAGA